MDQSSPEGSTNISQPYLIMKKVEQNLLAPHRVVLAYIWAYVKTEQDQFVVNRVVMVKHLQKYHKLKITLTELKFILKQLQHEECLTVKHVNKDYWITLTFHGFVCARFL